MCIFVSVYLFVSVFECLNQRGLRACECLSCVCACVFIDKRSFCVSLHVSDISQYLISSGQRAFTKRLFTRGLHHLTNMNHRTCQISSRMKFMLEQNEERELLRGNLSF